MEEIPLQSFVKGDKRSRYGQKWEPNSLVRNDSSGRVLVTVEKTPPHLTPSQRLQMRKQRLNDGITQYKFGIANETNTDLSINSDDEDIDDFEDIFNVPISSKSDWGTKFTRHRLESEPGLDSATVSARSSSIFSAVSDDLTCGSSVHDSHMNLIVDGKRPQLGTSMSNEAFELSMRFEADGKCRIMREARERRHLLSLLLKLGRTTSKDGKNVFESHMGKAGCEQLAGNLQHHLSTRPSWLPPKSLYDKIKHQKESEDLIYLALTKHTSAVQRKIDAIKKYDELKAADMDNWKKANYDDVKSLQDEEDGRKMYWRGIPNFKRAFVWSTILESEAKFSNELCASYFTKYSDLLCFELGNGRIRGEALTNLLKRVTTDLSCAFKDQELFRQVPAMNDIKESIFSFLLYYHDKELNEYGGFENLPYFLEKIYFLGLSNVSCLLYAVYRDKFMVFRTLCIFYLGDAFLTCLMRSRLNLVSKKDEFNYALRNSQLEAFQLRLEETCPSLSSHLKIRSIKPHDFVPLAFLSIMSDYFDFGLSMRVLDIWIFERNPFLVTSLLAMMKMISHKLFGSKDEIMSLLATGCIDKPPEEECQTPIDTHDFFHLVYNLMPK